jgi:acetyl-CoA carboxylase carboxyltransferase component
MAVSSEAERSADFDRRRERMEELFAELREGTAQGARGGGEKALERHRSRGKWTARERIARLLDPSARNRVEPGPPVRYRYAQTGLRSTARFLRSKT